MGAYVGIQRVTLTNQIPALNGTDGWTAGAGTLTADTSIKKYSANSLRLYGGSLAEALAITSEKYSYTAGHKYYIRCEVYFSSDVTYRRCSCYWPIAEPNVWNSAALNLSIPTQTWFTLAVSSDRVAAGHTAGSDNLRFDFDNNKAGGYMYLDGIMLIDLTAAFGAGNEPDQTWCNNNIPYFTGDKTISYDSAEGVAISAKKLYIGVNGVARKVIRAYVGVHGVARRWWGEQGSLTPVDGIAAGALAVGSSVYLMENGTAVEYLVVNQGKPQSSTYYDDSCDGTWLLRKDIYEKRKWDNDSGYNYANSTIHSYLNSTFLALFDADTQSQIQEVKIPYMDGTKQFSTSSYYSKTYYKSSGLSTKIFLLGNREAGALTASYNSTFGFEGARLEYFPLVTSSKDPTRIAYLNGTAYDWWLRSPLVTYPEKVYLIYDSGNYGTSTTNVLRGIRPALVLPFTARFDETTLILKGAS